MLLWRTLIPRHPHAPGVALTRKAETPKVPQRLGILLWHARGEHHSRPRATHNQAVCCVRLEVAAIAASMMTVRVDVEVLVWVVHSGRVEA